MKNITLSPLEEWMRLYYFDTELDLGSSGVSVFSLMDLRHLLNISQEELDAVVFHDSSSTGHLQLRQAIAQRWLHGDPEYVMVTHGSSEALFLVMNALLQPGDEVVVLDPCYQSFFSIAEAIGCQVNRWPMRFTQRFVPNLDELRSILSSRTRMVIVNFPHNPTGASLTPLEQQELIQLLRKDGIYCVWDAALRDLTYTTEPLPEPLLQYERAISVGTFSKAYGLPGLRFGWCLAAPAILQQCIRIRDYMTLHLSPIIEFLARIVVEKIDILLDIRLAQARANLDLLITWLQQNHQHVEWVPPQGGVTSFVRIKHLANTEEFCHYLARTQKVLLVPGTCFGYPEHVRLGFGCASAELVEGLARLSLALQTFNSGSPLKRL